MNHTIPCPGCGRMVDIPEGMDACFCTYCGARVTRSAPAEPAAECPDLDMAALRARYTPRELTGYLAWLAGLLPEPDGVEPAQLIPRFSWGKVPKTEIVVTAP